MEILQFLLSFLFKQLENGKLESIFNLFKNNSFDLKQVMSNLDLNTLEPIMKDLTKNKSTSPPCVSREVHKLGPIQSFADAKIISALNCYFENV